MAEMSSTYRGLSSVTWENVLYKPDTISKYGILDAYTKDQCDTKYATKINPTFTGSLLTTGDIVTKPSSGGGYYCHEQTSGMNYGFRLYQPQNAQFALETYDQGWHNVITGGTSYVSIVPKLGLGTVAPTRALDIAGTSNTFTGIGFHNTGMGDESYARLIMELAGNTFYISRYKGDSTGGLGMASFSLATGRMAVGATQQPDTWANLLVEGNSDGSGLVVGQSLTGNANAHQLILGYNYTDQRSQIQSVHQGVGYTPLYLNKDGGGLVFSCASLDNWGTQLMNSTASIYADGSQLIIAWKASDGAVRTLNFTAPSAGNSRTI